MEKGATPSGETLSKLSDYFDVSIDFLLTGEEQEKKPSSNEESEFNTQEIDFSKHLFAAYGDTPPNLSEAGMRDIAKYIRFVEALEKKDGENDPT